MQNAWKFLLAAALGAVPGQARIPLAFLGIDPGSDPVFGATLARQVHRDLATDTALANLPAEAVAHLVEKGVLEKPEAGPARLADLKLGGLEARFYAFGWLEPLGVAHKRTWWKPWGVKTRWTQSLRLRMVDGASGETVFDGRLPVEVLEKHWWTGPDAELSRQAPLVRDGLRRRMLPLLSGEIARTLSRVALEKDALGGAAADRAVEKPGKNANAAR